MSAQRAVQRVVQTLIATVALPLSWATAQPSPESVVVPPNLPAAERSPLGGVPAKIPGPHRGGSLLDQRRRPFPYPSQQPIYPTGGFDNGQGFTTTTIAPVVAANGDVIRPGLIVRDGQVQLESDSTRQFLDRANPIVVYRHGVDLSGRNWFKYPYYVGSSNWRRTSCDGTSCGLAACGANSPVFDARYPIDPAVLSGLRPAGYRDPESNAYTEIDLAEAALLERDYARAAQMYRAHLHLAPNDVETPRALAATLLMLGESEVAATLLASSHRRAPELAQAPLPLAVDATSAAFRQGVSNLMHLAQRRPTPEILFAAAVLKQWEGQPAVARRMLDRSKAAGFDRYATEALSLQIPHGQSKR